MNNNVKKAIKEHALRDAPNEACGFIYINDKSILAFPCKNISAEPTEEFEIEQDDYFECLRNGQIVGVYHSSAGSAFSEADIFHANEWPLPLYLYSLNEDCFKSYIPKNYAVDYLGRPFIWGQYDCYSIVRDYYRREFNVYLKDYDCDETFENGRRLDIVENFENEGFVKFEDFSNIKSGDVLLFKCGNEYHVGIYVDGNKFLHQPLRSQSRIEAIDGYWAKNLIGVLKHETRL